VSTRYGVKRLFIVGHGQAECSVTITMSLLEDASHGYQERRYHVPGKEHDGRRLHISFILRIRQDAGNRRVWSSKQGEERAQAVIGVCRTVCYRVDGEGCAGRCN